MHHVYSFEFRGYLAEGQGRRELVVWVASAQQEPEQEDWYCEIGGSLFSRSMKIRGVDAEQARTLAHSVIETILAGKLVLNSDGALIDWARLSKS